MTPKHWFAAQTQPAPATPADAGDATAVELQTLFNSVKSAFSNRNAEPIAGWGRQQPASGKKTSDQSA